MCCGIFLFVGVVSYGAQAARFDMVACANGDELDIDLGSTVTP